MYDYSAIGKSILCSYNAIEQLTVVYLNHVNKVTNVL